MVGEKEEKCNPEKKPNITPFRCSVLSVYSKSTLWGKRKNLINQFLNCSVLDYILITKLTLCSYLKGCRTVNDAKSHDTHQFFIQEQKKYFWTISKDMVKEMKKPQSVIYVPINHSSFTSLLLCLPQKHYGLLPISSVTIIKKHSLWQLMQRKGKLECSGNLSSHLFLSWQSYSMFDGPQAVLNPYPHCFMCFLFQA